MLGKLIRMIDNELMLRLIEEVELLYVEQMALRAYVAAAAPSGWRGQLQEVMAMHKAGTFPRGGFDELCRTYAETGDRELALEKMLTILQTRRRQQWGGS